MARSIVLTLGGAESHFNFRKLERKKLYGSRRRISLDAGGEACRRAALAEDGLFLVQSGMSAQGYFTDENSWVPNSELVGICDGRVVEKLPSTLNEAHPLQNCTPQMVLDHRLSTIYMLDVQNIDALLEKALDGGEVFTFPFNYQADFRTETGFVLKNDEGIFVLVGVEAKPEWLESGTPPPLGEEDESEMDDELDFEMF